MKTKSAKNSVQIKIIYAVLSLKIFCDIMRVKEFPSPHFGENRKGKDKAQIFS